VRLYGSTACLYLKHGAIPVLRGSENKKNKEKQGAQQQQQQQQQPVQKGGEKICQCFLFLHQSIRA
jgi:hypothetical protein